jgi:hypothetical protein
MLPMPRPGLARQRQKRGLKSVCGILLVIKPAPAHAQHHCPVTPHQHCEGAVILPGRESLQQLPVG